MLHEASLIQALGHAISVVVSSHSHSQWTGRVVAVQEGAKTRARETSAVALLFEGTASGEAYLSVGPELSRTLFPEMVGAEAQLSAWLAICESSSSQVGDELRTVQPDLTLGGCRIVTLGLAATPLGMIEMVNEKGSAGHIELFANPTLLSNLQAAGTETATASRSVSDLQDKEGSPRLERVIDVPLAVHLRFGQRQLTLRELLDLNTGALLELDRQVEEPVELVLGERVIARGEVVIVDGNYGLRVTEVVEVSAQRLLAHA